MKLVCQCGGQVIITENSQGEPASLLHTMPMCQEYEMLEPDEFLRWLRGHIEGQMDG